MLQSSHTVIAVYTQPDRPSGRGKKTTPSPVKELALAHDLPVYQPASLKQPAACDQLRALKADILVVVAYGLILPKQVLEIAPQGAINVHASILPRWRGAAPIQRAILAGDKTSGVTIMQMDVGLDTGDIVSSRECAIDSADTSLSLTKKLAQLGANLLVETLNEIEKGVAQCTRQDDSASCYAHKLLKSDGIIDWSTPVTHIDAQVRAMNPWPGAVTELDGQSLKIWQAEPIFSEELTAGSQPGQIVRVGKLGIIIATGNGFISLKELQLSGSKRLTFKEFVNSGKMSVGMVLG